MEKTCKQKLQDKIKQNIEEYKNGEFKSRAQAIAVSYSQINRKYPHCRQHILSRSSRAQALYGLT